MEYSSAAMKRCISPKVVSLAENEVRLGIERGAHLAEARVAASALEAVLVPVHVQRLQQEPLGDDLPAGGALAGGTCPAPPAPAQRQLDVTLTCGIRQ